MREYPKIETAWNREGKYVVPGSYRLPELESIKRFVATEKVDGTNIRIGLHDARLLIGGRTDNAQVPTPLLEYLMATFTVEKLLAQFPDGNFTLFGEGYGPKIQGGGNYRSTASFRLFDVLVAQWWLEPMNVVEVANSLGIEYVPALGLLEAIPRSADELRIIVDASVVASQDGGSGRRAEGIVARPVPMLLNRKGERLLWKLKFRDFHP